MAPSSVSWAWKLMLKSISGYRDNGLSGPVVHRKTPVFGVTIRVARQIVQNMHAAVNNWVQTDTFRNGIEIMVDRIHIIGDLGNHGIPL